MVIIDPPTETLSLLREACNLPTEEPASSESLEILAYVASLASSLTSVQDFDSSTWIESLSPYLATLPGNGENCDDTIEKLPSKFPQATPTVFMYRIETQK